MSTNVQIRKPKFGIKEKKERKNGNDFKFPTGQEGRVIWGVDSQKLNLLFL